MPKKPLATRSGPSQRQLRVGELIRHALSELLARGEIHDDVITSHVITVSEVRMSPDLRLATIYIMPLGGENFEPVLDAFERNRRYIRGVVARAVNLKFAPDIRFRKDESFESGDRIDRILDSLKLKQEQEEQ